MADATRTFQARRSEAWAGLCIVIMLVAMLLLLGRTAQLKVFPSQQLRKHMPSRISSRPELARRAAVYRLRPDQHRLRRSNLQQTNGSPAQPARYRPQQDRLNSYCVSPGAETCPTPFSFAQSLIAAMSVLLIDLSSDFRSCHR